MRYDYDGKRVEKIMFVIDDIIWLDNVAEKLAWKHHVLTNEVEEVLAGNCRFFKKETSKVEGEHLYNALGRTVRYSLSKN